MKKCAGLLVINCLFVCLTFNSTRPLYNQDQSDQTVYVTYANQSLRRDLNRRSNKMASYLENTLQGIKDSKQDLGTSIYDRFNNVIKTMVNKNALTEDEMRRYEEIVIMKKYPYLDFKELPMKYSPLFSKNIRQSAIFAVDPNLQNEPGICDAAEDLQNVEITNRGLSGFAIPPLHAKKTGTSDSKLVNTIFSKTNNSHHEGGFSKVFR